MTIDIPVRIELPAQDAFWDDVAAEAARIDIETLGPDGAGGPLSRAQALVRLFHYDGTATLCRIANRHGEPLSWEVAVGWDRVDGLVA